MMTQSMCLSQVGVNDTPSVTPLMGEARRQEGDGGFFRLTPHVTLHVTLHVSTRDHT